MSLNVVGPALEHKIGFDMFAQPKTTPWSGLIQLRRMLFLLSISLMALVGR
jgi:hypothetical protein